jgi:L-asparaginase II
MEPAQPLVEIWRGPFCESMHRGHAVIWDSGGDIVAAWGDPQAVILPRSACKMIQALPLIEGGAADAFGLGDAQLALSCASHQGAAVHTDMVTDWLDALRLVPETALRCGPQEPNDRAAREGLIRAHESPCQIHNNCSGKHSGFLTLAKHLGAGPEYNDLDHPVQRAALAAFEDVTGEISPGHAIDGCSAPNHASSITGLARAMAVFAAATGTGDTRDRAMARLTHAMATHPHLVAGKGRAVTGLMHAMKGRVAVKSGAEGVYIAIVPETRMGVAVKIEDGGARAAEATITQILIGMGVLDANHPVARQYTFGPIRNRRDIETGYLKPVKGLSGWRL